MQVAEVAPKLHWRKFLCTIPCSVRSRIVLNVLVRKATIFMLNFLPSIGLFRRAQKPSMRCCKNLVCLSSRLPDLGLEGSLHASGHPHTKPFREACFHVRYAHIHVPVLFRKSFHYIYTSWSKQVVPHRFGAVVISLSFECIFCLWK